MRKFYELLREHAIEITIFKKGEKMKLLTKEQQESYEMQKPVIF